MYYVYNNLTKKQALYKICFVFSMFNPSWMNDFEIIPLKKLNKLKRNVLQLHHLFGPTTLQVFLCQNNKIQ